MSELMEIAVGDGTTVAVIEVEGNLASDDLVMASRLPNEVALRAVETLGQMLDRIRPVMHTLRDWASEARPDEIGIEFGLKFGGESGLIIAKGTAEVNFLIKCTWK